MKKELLFFSIILLSSYALTHLIRVISIRRNIMDIPNPRSSHSIPTPRGGGFAIVLSWYAGLTFMYMESLIDAKLYLALLSGLFLGIISFIDDIMRINPIIRLFVQFITASLAFFFLGGIEPLVLFNTVILPDYVLYPVVVTGMVWFINLYNFLDGIDGYAAIEAIALAVSFIWLTGDSINFLLITAVSGFLIWNYPKAKIFMGDVGSTQLGFILIVLGINYHNKGILPVIWWVILTSPFWFDATLTLYRRWRNKEKLSEAHRKHIYQRLVQSGFSHLKVDIGLLVVNIILIGMVLFFRTSEMMQIPVLLIASVMLYFIARYTDQRKPFPKD